MSAEDDATPGPPGEFVGDDRPGSSFARGHEHGVDGERRADTVLAETLRDEARSACRRVRAAWRDLWR
jgi:hypothetical protein